MRASFRTTRAYLKNIETLEWLERASSDLVRRYLESFGDWFNDHHGSRCSGTQPPLDWPSIRIAFARNLPSALVQSVIDVGQLAAPDGVDEVIAVTGQAGLLLPFAIPTDLALRCYLDHPSLFRTALLSVQTKAARRFTESDAATPLSLPASDLPSRIERLERGLRHDLRVYPMYGACNIGTVETDSELALLLTHGASALSSSDCSACVMAGRSSLAVYHKRYQTLCISARFPITAEGLRRAIGDHLFAGSNCFSTRPVYTAAPLSMMGTAALGTAGIPELCNVSLQCIKLRQGGGVGVSHELAGADLHAWWTDPLLRQHVVCDQVSYFQLGLRMAGWSVSRPIDIWPPNRVCIDRNLDEAIVRALLQYHGFRLRSHDDFKDPSGGAEDTRA